MSEKDLQGVIKLAIEKEEEAYEFYTDLKDLVEGKEAKETMGFLAAEEKKHKEFLVRYRDSGVSPDKLSLNTVVDYHITEHLEQPEPTKKTGLQEAYLIAAHRELHSYNFYKALAEVHPEGSARELLLVMANEELKHKEKVEYLYTNTAFPQTEGG
jgi:rubrerythrin